MLTSALTDYRSSMDVSPLYKAVCIMSSCRCFAASSPWSETMREAYRQKNVLTLEGCPSKDEARVVRWVLDFGRFRDRAS